MESTSDTYDLKNIKSGSSASPTFHDVNKLRVGNYSTLLKDIAKDSYRSRETEIEQPSEFDDETTSSKTKEKSPTYSLSNDAETSKLESTSVREKVEYKSSPPLNVFFARQESPIEENPNDRSIVSGCDTEFSDNFTFSVIGALQSENYTNGKERIKNSDREKESKTTIFNKYQEVVIPEEHNEKYPLGALLFKNISEKEKVWRRSVIRNSIPQSPWPKKYPSINTTKSEEKKRHAWASPRLQNLYHQQHLLNHICADCSSPLTHADSIYASFHVSPTSKKLKKKKSKINKKVAPTRKIARHRSVIETVKADLDSDTCSENELFNEEIEVRSRDSNTSYLQNYKIEKNEDLEFGNRIHLRKSFSNNREWEDAEDMNEKQKSFKRNKKKHKDILANNSMYHIADFKKLHAFYGSAGAVTQHIPKTCEGNNFIFEQPKTSQDFVHEHGVFICKKCAHAHNIMGRQITTVKSVFDSTHWCEEELFTMETRGGNLYSKEVLEAHLPPYWKKSLALHEKSSFEVRIMYIKAKYYLLAFISPIGPLSRVSKWENLLNNRNSLDNPDVEGRSLRLPGRLIDYFCVVGATRNIHHQGILSRASFDKGISFELQPKIWDCFPPPDHSHSDMPLPSFITHFAFPNGCRPSSKKKEPHFFTFVLTLEYTNAKIYCSSLVVYEDIVYMDQIMDCLYEKGYSSIKNTAGNVHGIETSSRGKHPSDRQKLYLPKALIVVSHYPLVNVHRTFLQQIYLLANSKSTPLPIERYISNFCSDIPLPPQGQVQMKFGYFDNDEGLNVTFFRPPKNDLPLIGSSFRPLFTSLSVSNILVTFGCLLQKNAKVVLCSKHTSMLTPVAESLRGILYPFTWQGIYIPLLPSPMMDILLSPSSFLIGMHSRYLAIVNKKDRPIGVVFVDLDKDIVHLGFEDGDSTSRERRTPKLPEKEVEKLKSKLEQFGALAYLPPPGGQIGRLTSGFGLETVLNIKREKYAYQTAMHRNSVSEKKRKNSPKEEFGQMRASILNKVDEAFVNDEHLKAIYFPKTTLGFGAKFVKDDVNNKFKKNDNGQEKVKSSLLDPNVDEKGGFSVSEIRGAFLRFFAVLFRNYEKFLIVPKGHENKSPKLEELFDTQNFLRKTTNPHEIAWEFLSNFMCTKMFRQFILEKMENPELPEIKYFDETIIVRKNYSKKNKLKGGLKKTPFLSDKSDWDFTSYTLSPPSSFNLPTTRGFYRKKFPRLRPQFYSSPRKMKQWQSQSFQRRTCPSYLFHNEMFSKLYMPSPYSYTPARDVQWALMVSAYKQPVCTDITYTLLDSKGLSHLDKMNCLLKASIITGIVETNAKDKLNKVRNTNLRLLLGLTKFQALFRMYGLRRHYKKIVSAIIFLQNYVRDFLFRCKYGSTFKGVNAKATDIQRVYRGYRGRLHKFTVKKSMITIALRFKAFLIRKKFIKKKRAATLIAFHFRIRHYRIAFKLLRKLVATIQAHIRGWLKRKSISRLRKERLLSYRTQLFKLWQRSATPLSYRSTFWKLLGKNSFLYLSLHEEELVRVWGVLGVDVPASVTVYEKFQQVQQMLDEQSKRYQSDYLFPAESPQKQTKKINKQQEFLRLSKIRESAERQKLYSILKDMDHERRHRVFQLFNLDEREIKKKERIVKCLWNYRSLIKPSITFILNVYDEHGNLENTFMRKGCMGLFGKQHTNLPPTSVLKRFDLDLNSHEGQTRVIVKRCAKNMSTWVQAKIDERVQNDLMGTTRGFLDAMCGKRNTPVKNQTNNDIVTTVVTIRSKSESLQLVRDYLARRENWSR